MSLNWYERRHELLPDMVFRDIEGDLLRLDRRVPGDGTNWYAAVWTGSHWSFDDHETHPSDLVSLENDPESKAESGEC